MRGVFYLILFTQLGIIHLEPDVFQSDLSGFAPHFAGLATSVYGVEHNSDKITKGVLTSLQFGLSHYTAKLKHHRKGR
jgi:hypothetical protein